MTQGPGPKALFEQAVQHHRAGQWAQAEQLYGLALAAAPGLFNPRWLLGVIRLQTGSAQEALALADAALALSDPIDAVVLGLAPDRAEALSVRASALQALRRPQEALAGYDEILTLKPGHIEALNNRGGLLWTLGRPAEALEAFDRLLAIEPRHAEALNNRAVILRDLRRHDEALDSFDAALAVQPGNPDLLYNRANTLRVLGRLDEALEGYQAASTVRPDYPEALAARAQLLLETGRLDEGMAGFRRLAELTRDRPRAAAPPHKAHHDAEQAAHLGAQTLTWRLEPGARLAGRAVNPDADGAATRWTQSHPRTVIIDDLLTEEALIALRRFCRGSTMWERAYPGGYIGAMPETGFAAPLLAQIAEELRAAYPDILADHPLIYLWAYSYDSRLEGIQVHADSAVVNVNFWITPDEANLDPDSGGLVVWDAVAPKDWDFARYNRDVPAIRQFLADSGATSIRAPYRCNRAVIFDSDLFHETDAIAFKDGYENRRINVTMLFGKRQPA